MFDIYVQAAPEIIANLSRLYRLMPGDLVYTGTPDGVGAARGRFLGDGELLVSGAEVIGELHNRCITPAAS